MARPSTIAIDGPAGCGKSTISQQLAEKYGYIFVDTGAFYRAITYIVLQAGLALDDIAAIVETANQLQLRFEVGNQADDNRVIANGEDVTDSLRTKAVEQYVSTIAKIQGVRDAILPLQQRVAQQGNIILAGRDIGTVVLPNADLKIFLDASLEERARRRYLQMSETAKPRPEATIRQELEERDRADSERSNAPLKQADDAKYVSTDGKTIEAVVAEIERYIIRE